MPRKMTVQPHDVTLSHSASDRVLSWPAEWWPTGTGEGTGLFGPSRGMNAMNLGSSHGQDHTVDFVAELSWKGRVNVLCLSVEVQGQVSS